MADKGLQSGVIPFRLRDGEVEILLITNSSGNSWIVPKGIVEPDLDEIESAQKEAVEEGGISGNVLGHPVGSYQQKKWGLRWRVTLFAMEVTQVDDDWPEAHFRKRKWVRLKDVATFVEHDDMRKLILRVPKTIASRTQAKPE